MRFYNFEIVIEKEAEDEGYSAHSPSLPGCFSNGATIDEAKRNMREAIQQHVTVLGDQPRRG
jgi:predicted RNase H-like HicB family nuclease